MTLCRCWDLRDPVEKPLAGAQSSGPAEVRGREHTEGWVADGLGPEVGGVSPPAWFVAGESGKTDAPAPGLDSWLEIRMGGPGQGPEPG